MKLYFFFKEALADRYFPYQLSQILSRDGSLHHFKLHIGISEGINLFNFMKNFSKKLFFLFVC